MFLGYNTNGLAHHALPAAFELLSSLGYRGVAITVDHAALNPWSPNHQQELTSVASELASRDMRSVVETGARYLMDARRKHFPTLLEAEETQRRRRIDFLKACVDIAAALDSDCVSLWSGALDSDTTPDQAWPRLLDGLREVLDYAANLGVVVGFEPEPGMLIDTMQRFEELHQRIQHPAFQLTLDLGHLWCQREVPLEKFIRQWADSLVNIHIEDMKAGVHEHLMFGEGEMDFPPVIAALHEVGYEGGVFVELSRHSHQGPVAAQQAHDFLSPMITQYRPT